MPDVGRLFVKASLVFFVLTFVSGASSSCTRRLGGWKRPGGWLSPTPTRGRLGWLALMVMGVAYWMFPLDKKRF